MTIYDTNDIDSENWLNNNELKKLLDIGLIGFQSNTAPRTRSKAYKQKICEVLGCKIETSFKKTQPRFPIQNFDLYIQSSNNLQIWNEVIDLNRRYVIIRIDSMGKYITLKIINGTDLIMFDSTGKLTSKFQAILNIKDIENKLYSKQDTENITQYITYSSTLNKKTLPSSLPRENELLTIDKIYSELLEIIGISFDNIASDRVRGDKIHEFVSRKLGYETFSDNGQFPDIRNQLLEVKAQASPTIDIGKEDPKCDRLQEYGDLYFSNEDIRYAIIYIEIGETVTTIKNIIMVNGKSFFKVFKPMNGVNTKIQLPLPKNFFD